LRSSAGWVLPNGARRSPGAGWVLKSRIKDLDPAAFSAQAAERGCKESPTLPQKPRGARPLCAELVENRYWPVCPDFVIELRSQSDRASVLREKMGEWLANCAQRGWLIDPEVRTVEICRPGFEAETIGGVPSVAGEGPARGIRAGSRAGLVSAAGPAANTVHFVRRLALW